MPCENCATQFTIFKRKRTCTSCQRFYCTSCLGKRKKSVCFRCEIFLQRPAPTKSDLMDLKTRDLIFYLQSKKINIAGIVEKEELANMIINHVNSSSYYDTGTHSSARSDFDSFDQSFDQIKQTCQNLFTSISDKISSGNHDSSSPPQPIKLTNWPIIFFRFSEDDVLQPTESAKSATDDSTTKTFNGCNESRHTTVAAAKL